MCEEAVVRETTKESELKRRYEERKTVGGLENGGEAETVNIHSHRTHIAKSRAIRRNIYALFQILVSFLPCCSSVVHAIQTNPEALRKITQCKK